MSEWPWAFLTVKRNTSDGERSCVVLTGNWSTNGHEQPCVVLIGDWHTNRRERPCTVLIGNWNTNDVSDHVRSSSGIGTPTTWATMYGPHQELKHLTSMKARQSSVDDDTKRCWRLWCRRQSNEDNDIEEGSLEAWLWLWQWWTQRIDEEDKKHRDWDVEDIAET